jgi:hypothetical protein
VSYYNPNVDLFISIRILYEFQSCGYITVIPNYRLMRMDKYHMTTFSNFVEIGAQGVVLFLVGFYILQEVRQVISDGPVAYFKSFWNSMDIINLLLFVAVAFLRITSTFQIQSSVLSASSSTVKSSLLQNMAFTIDLEKNLIGLNCVLMWVKFLKYVSAHKKFNKITRTIGTSGKEIGVFFIIFGISAYGFALGGTLMLGMEDSNYKDLSRSFQTLILVAFGDLQFQDLYRSNKVLGPLFLLLWILYVRGFTIPSYYAVAQSSTSLAGWFAVAEHGHQYHQRRSCRDSRQRLAGGRRTQVSSLPPFFLLPAAFSDLSLQHV